MVLQSLERGTPGTPESLATERMSTVSVTNSNPARQPASSDRLGPLIGPHVWWRIALIVALFVPLHWDIIGRLIRFAWTDGDWSHAFIVPLISLYFVHQRRDDLKAIEPRTCWWALPLLLIGMAGYFLSIYPIRNDMLKGYFMILEIFAIVLLLAGPRVIMITWLPIVYLVFAVKVSQKYWTIIAENLQLLAAKSSVVTLQLFGIDATVSGTTIDLWHGMQPLGSLNVAEACSGLRMLMTFIALGVAMAYLWDRPWWARLTMVLLTVPIAVVVNVGRVTVIGLLYLIDPKYSAGDFHLFMGMLMLIPACGLFLLLGWVLNKIVLHVPDGKERRNKKDPV
jgi:exosortase